MSSQNDVRPGKRRTTSDSDSMPSSTSFSNSSSSTVATASSVHQWRTRYGCEHVKSFLQFDSRDEVFSNYELISALSGSILPRSVSFVQRCRSCKEHLLGPTYLCLQCPGVSCRQHARQHAKEKQHYFGVCSRKGCVFCFHCMDYIYDPVLEDLRSPRIRRGRWKEPPDESEKSISTEPPCTGMLVQAIY